ncbi:MAG: (deoxy)nucleoside triphosphate pyrophosphohydrolase [Bryobacterales bacterium]|nr:(deoxy)nucleoside triphosphate pyrophosphohydrolase [Bryobacterales bacterium]
MSSPRPPLLVVAAVIKRNGRFLIAQRRSTGSFPLKWEFPGGKLEAGESPKQALRRELQEELGVDAEIGAEIGRYECAYPNFRKVTILFFDVPSFEGEPANLAFQQFVWEERQHLKGYDFLDGDLDFVRRLVSGQVLPD